MSVWLMTVDKHDESNNYIKMVKPPTISPNPDKKSTENPINELSKSFKNIKLFDISQAGEINQNISSKLEELYNWNESLTWILAKNKQIQLLLSELLYDYSNYIWSDKERLKQQINQWGVSWTQAEVAGNYYEYLSINDNMEWFLNFLVSSDCLDDVLLPYFSLHNDKNWEIRFISEKDIKAKIKAAYNKKLFEDYTTDMHGADIKEIQHLNTMWALIKNKIDSVVYWYLSKNGDYDIWKNAEFIGTLNSLYERVDESKNRAKDLKYSEDQIFYMIRTSIKEYSRLLNLSDKHRTLKKTGDNVFDIQLRSYLFLYWKLFYGDKFIKDWKSLNDYEWELWKLLDAILAKDWFFKEWRKEGNEYNELEDARYKEWMDRDKMKNNSMRWRRAMRPSKKPEWPDFESIENGDFNVNEATWVEIAQEMWLWNELSDFKVNEKFVNSDAFKGRITFRKTCKEFFRERWEDLAKFKIKIGRLFRLNTQGYWLSINHDEWKTITDNLDNNEVNELKSLLNQFISKFNDNLKFVNDNVDHNKGIVDNTVKNHAIWAVIDNVKDMFQNIVDTNNAWVYISWFEFKENDAAKIDGNNLIMSGKFNWETLILKYDLKTGKLYMNAYISNIKDGGTPTIIIWDNSPNQPIWEIRPFQKVLDDFCLNPTESMSNEFYPRLRTDDNLQSNRKEDTDEWKNRLHRPRRNFRERERSREENKRKFQETCNTKINEIKLTIKKKVETKSVQNHSVSNLLKTLGIIPDSGDIENIKKFRWWNSPSDLYKIIQLITNEHNINTIDKFSKNMETLVNDYIWLEWGQNKDHQDKTVNKAPKIFDESNKQEYISTVRDNTKNFDTEYSHSNGKAQFNEEVNFWLLKLIEDNFTEGDYPNRKLSSNNMETFMEWLGAELDLETSFENIESTDS